MGTQVKTSTERLLDEDSDNEAMGIDDRWFYRSGISGSRSILRGILGVHYTTNEGHRERLTLLEL